MSRDAWRMDRRAFLRRATVVSVGTISGRGLYTLLDAMGAEGPRRVEAAPTRRKQEQYLIDSLEVILDNDVPVVIPPLYNDVITAKLASGRKWDVKALLNAQGRVEDALRRIESPYDATAAGLTIVVGWGLPYFRRAHVSSLAESYLPVDVALSTQTGTKQYAVLDAVTFPSDPAGLLLEENEVMFKLRSDSQTILQDVERALFEDPTNRAYIGDLFSLTSKRIGFLGRGFDRRSIGKELALAAGVPGAEQIPDNAQLMLGFTSTQHAALGPSNLPSFETLPDATDQFPSGYFASGCAMHLSRLSLDLALWYNSFDYSARVARMFSPGTPVPGATTTVTLPNGPGNLTSLEQLKEDASTTGLVGHNATLQQATRLPADITDNYGRLQPKGTPVPLREDFNTLDNPFAWTATPTLDGWSSTAAPGMHFVVFVPTSHRFHTARRAMDGVLPDGTNLREAPYHITDAQNGINAMMRATHRQNYLIPPRARRSFPLVELLR